MGKTQIKYCLLIPQTYISIWANATGTLEVEFLSNPGVLETTIFMSYNNF